MAATLYQIVSLDVVEKTGRVGVALQYYYAHPLVQEPLKMDRALRPSLRTLGIPGLRYDSQGIPGQMNPNVVFLGLKVIYPRLTDAFVLTTANNAY